MNNLKMKLIGVSIGCLIGLFGTFICVVLIMLLGIYNNKLCNTFKKLDFYIKEYYCITIKLS